MTDLLDTAPCGFFRFADDGVVLYANDTLSRLLGADGLAGRSIDTVLSPGARIFYQTHVFPLLRVEGRVEEIYLSLRSADGTDVPVLLNAVRREDGEQPITDAVVVPMRRRNQFESELLQAKHAAEEASRARARFLSVLSHDLRAPLSAINLGAEILALGGSGPITEAQRRDLDRIKDSSAYVLRLVTDLLNFSRATTGRINVSLQPVEMERATARATDTVEHLATRAGLSLQRVLHDPAATAHADPERLQQLLLNLLTNAIKFTPSGGRITVVTEPDGERIRLHVRDTGCGIAEEALERIFDPFVQLNQSSGAPHHEGVGLGLAISRELARAMAGDLTVTSRLGEGTDFVVTLPVAPTSAG